MTQTIKAIYQNGVFKPLEPLKVQIEEGQRVILTIYPIEKVEQENFSNEK